MYRESRLANFSRNVANSATPDPVALRTARYSALNRRLSMFSALIFDSSVDEGTPSLAAAPNGPDTRPMLSLKAASIASFASEARNREGDVTVG